MFFGASGRGSPSGNVLSDARDDEVEELSGTDWRWNPRGAAPYRSGGRSASVDLRWFCVRCRSRSGYRWHLRSWHPSQV